MKAIYCVTYLLVSVVVIGTVSCRSHSLQHHRPKTLDHHGPSFNADNKGLLTTEKKHKVFHYPSVKNHDYLRLRNASRNGGKGSVHVCGLCPASEEIVPCMCHCLNETAAELKCGPELLSCSQLTEVMCLTAYPVNSYLRLVVQNTELSCNLEKNLWGPIMFKEIVLTNNRFQALDNHAFQPFSSTLTSLDLGGNSLKNVYFYTMNDTPLLKMLSLRDNNIEFLPGYSVMELAVLEVFDAAFNQITSIIPQTFAGMPKLQMIDLSNNAITKVSAGAFNIPQHTAANLIINLAHNAIYSVEPGMLEGVRACSINLKDNHLTILSEKVFRPIIDFTAASSVFWTSNNPFDCDSQFCWIATNATVSSTFNTVLCPNLGNEPVEVLTPMCSLNITEVTRPHRMHPLLEARTLKS